MEESADEATPKRELKPGDPVNFEIPMENGGTMSIHCIYKPHEAKRASGLRPFPHEAAEFEKVKAERAKRDEQANTTRSENVMVVFFLTVFAGIAALLAWLLFFWK